MTQADGRHRTEISRATCFGHRGDGAKTTFTAYCDCGWVGREMERRRDAEEDADEHVRLM